MKLPQTVANFSINIARYHIASRAGTQATLVVNYAKNSYYLEYSAGKSADAGLQAAASEIAMDLLGRKHGVNFAKQK